MEDKTVYDYYKNGGWSMKSGVYFDTEINENLQKAASEYNTQTRRRVLHVLNILQLKKSKSLLDVASGPIQYPEYLEYSRPFAKRVCVDFSQVALEGAKNNLENDLQDNGVFICADFLNLNIKPNTFGASISLHTLYHIQIEKQKDFVEKLIEVTEPDGLVIIVYSNPLSFRSFIRIPSAIIMRILRWTRRKALDEKVNVSAIYCKRWRRSWWKQFNSFGIVSFKTYRLFTPSFEKSIIPDNFIGKILYNILFKIEESKFSLFLADYYMIVIKKFS